MLIGLFTIKAIEYQNFGDPSADANLPTQGQVWDSGVPFGGRGVD